MNSDLSQLYDRIASSSKLLPASERAIFYDATEDVLEELSYIILTSFMIEVLSFMSYSNRRLIYSFRSVILIILM